MISQNAGISVESPYPIYRTETVKVDLGSKKPAENTGPHFTKDEVIISKNSKVDYALFNFFNEGGDATEVLSGEVNSDKPFTIEPDFRNVSASRYSQMKTEIERVFAEDQAARSRYIRELDRARDDYNKLQEKIAEELSSKHEKVVETEDDQTDGTVSELYKSGYTEPEREILDRIFSGEESQYSEEVAKVMSDYFIGNHRQSGAKHNDPKNKQVWNTIKFQTASYV